MTCNWCLVFLILVLLIDFLREASLFSACDRDCDDRPVNQLGVLLVFFKLTAGIGCIWSFRRYAGSLISLDLRDSPTSEDMENIQKYMKKKNFLKDTWQKFQESEVLEGLRDYLRSTDKLFLIFPWLHTGLIVIALFKGGLFDNPGYNELSEWTQAICIFIDALTTFTVIGIGNSVVSLYHVQYKILIDIYKVASQSRDTHTSGDNMPPKDSSTESKSCGPGMQNIWKKLRNQIERTAGKTFWLTAAGIPFQVYLLAWESWYYIAGLQQKSRIDIIAVALLLFSEALANCPCRWMKKTGLTLDAILLLASLLLPVTPIPYGNTQLIIFRRLSFKLTCVLCLQFRLTMATSDWPYHDVPQPTVKSERLRFVMIFYLFAILLDIPLAS